MSRSIIQVGIQPNKSSEDPTKYKTEMCKNWVESGGMSCPYRYKCRFAHGHEEVQQKSVGNGRYRSKPCFQFHKNLYCIYGSRCLFYHGEKDEEMREQQWVESQNMEALLNPKYKVT